MRITVGPWPLALRANGACAPPRILVSSSSIILTNCCAGVTPSTTCMPIARAEISLISSSATLIFTSASRRDRRTSLSAVWMFLSEISLLPCSLFKALFMRSDSVSNIMRVEVSREARPRRGAAAAMCGSLASRCTARCMPAAPRRGTCGARKAPHACTHSRHVVIASRRIVVPSRPPITCIRTHTHITRANQHAHTHSTLCAG
mmetsp:Transcript_11376/g.17998  ORF Transcript_11376/g.17998 Transcript_11376/m.17998 type:complete len:204 (+) Transcript_11376:1282-1893(+)